MSSTTENGNMEESKDDLQTKKTRRALSNRQKMEHAAKLVEGNITIKTEELEEGSDRSENGNITIKTEEIEESAPEPKKKKTRRRLRKNKKNRAAKPEEANTSTEQNATEPAGKSATESAEDITYDSDYDDEEWEFVEILACRKVGKVLEYLVKWLNVDDSQPEWYNASFLKSAPYKLKAFHLSNPGAPGPPRKLFEWIKEYEDRKEDWAMDEDMRRRFFERGGEM